MRTVCAVLLLVCTACDSPATDDEDAGRDAGMMGVDAGTIPDAGMEIDGGPLLGYGRIFLEGQSATANFHHSTDGTEGCMSVTRTPCVIERCMDTPEATPPHAGPIEIDNDGTLVATLTPDASGLYPSLTPTTPLWTGGEVIRIHAAGAEVPAFDWSLLGVTEVDVTEPDFSMLSTLDRSAPFEIHWSPTTGSLVTLAFLQMGLQIRCYFAVRDGMGIAPARALTDLVSGQPATIAVIAEDRRFLTSPGWLVRVATRAGGTQNGVRILRAVNVQ